MYEGSVEITYYTSIFFMEIPERKEKENEKGDYFFLKSSKTTQIWYKVWVQIFKRLIEL